MPAGEGERPRAVSLLVDHEGNRWIGTLASGLYRLRPAPVTAYGKPEGLSDAVFHAVFQDRDGRIWLGGERLHWFDGRRFVPVPGLADIRAIAQTRDGNLWFGGSGGLYRWSAGVLRRFRIDAPAVNGILEDRQGTLWVVAQSYERPGGLYRLKEEKLERVAADVLRMVEDREGGLWLATSRGLEHRRDGRSALYPRKLSAVSDMYQDPAGTLWIAEYASGLLRFRDGEFRAITPREGLPNNLPDALLADDAGHLWLGTDHNVYRFRQQELNDVADGKVPSVAPVSYGIPEGMRTSECNSGSPGAFAADDGRLWFPTLRGVVAIDPAVGDRRPPPVVIEEVRANGSRLERGADRDRDRGAASVPPGNGTLEFRFTALCFSAPDKARFRYRLEPYEKDWVDAGSRRHAHYTNMAPGEYSFRVIAANDSGVWNEQGAGVRFVLQPHAYQTAWFRALCATCAALLVWGAYRLRIGRLRRQFERTLDARVDERTRIARELHDTLLQSAHGMLLRYQTASCLLPGQPQTAKERLDEAIAQSADFITEARDRVQGLRVSAAESNDLALAIGALGEELKGDPAADRPVSFQVAVEGEARDLHPIVRDETYRIVAEALRNAFRHAAARRVEVELRYDRAQFRLRVRDDGRGIDPAVLATRGATGHYGLRGMTERARVIRGDLAVWSQPGAGTEVELRVPARVAYVSARRRGWPWRKFPVARGREEGGPS